MRFLFLWLMTYPTCCGVRASIALPPGRARFWATCGVTLKFRHSDTKSAVSYALSPPTVTCLVPKICCSIASANQRRHWQLFERILSTRGREQIDRAEKLERADAVRDGANRAQAEQSCHLE